MNIEIIEDKKINKQKKGAYKGIIFDILSQPNSNDNFYSKYKYSKEEIKVYQYYQKGKIIEEIEQYIQKVIPENRNINENEIIENIRATLITLPKEKRNYFIKKILDIVNKFNTVRKYLDFEHGPYKTPKELLCAMRGIKDPKIIKRIRGKIIVKQYGPGLIFFINENYCYNIVITGGNNGWGNGSSGTYFRKESGIAELEGTLTVINGNSKDDKSVWMMKHDGQHMRNRYFMPTNQLPITDAKDEIIAYLRDGRGIFKEGEPPETIVNLLTGHEYQYELKGKKREKHKKLVKELLTYANDLIELTKDKKTGLTKDLVISMLGRTPAYKRKELHFNIMEAVNIHNNRNSLQKEIKSFSQQFLPKIKNRIGNKKVTKNLIRRWNLKFPSYSNLSNGVEFWRALTAEKKTVINEIIEAKSIEEIKYILEDPKYSHISRGPNNKGGIEVSAIIDEVIAGYLPITFLPPEIREIIEKFIEK